MIINTDYEQLRTLVTTLYNQISDYSTYFDSINEHLNQFSGWTGKDNKKYTEQAAVLKANIEKMIRNIKALAEDVNTGANKYKEAADTISPHAGRI